LLKRRSSAYWPKVSLSLEFKQVLDFAPDFMYSENRKILLAQPPRAAVPLISPEIFLFKEPA
jgi:hypothetical protein